MTARTVRPVARAAWLAGTAVAVWAAPLEAQIPKLTAEGRVGIAIPAGELAGPPQRDGGAGAGSSFGVSFAYAVRGGLYLQLGFSQHRFLCAEGCQDTGDLTSSGYDLALRYLFDTGAVMPWLRLGAISHGVEASSGAADDGKAVSDWTWGIEAGAGLSVRLTDNLRVTPGFRYLRLDPTLDRGTEVPFRSWVVDVGLLWGF
jgi:opacity protein-like surface antigen